MFRRKKAAVEAAQASRDAKVRELLTSHAKRVLDNATRAKEAIALATASHSEKIIVNSNLPEDKQAQARRIVGIAKDFGVDRFNENPDLVHAISQAMDNIAASSVEGDPSPSRTSRGVCEAFQVWADNAHELEGHEDIIDVLTDMHLDGASEEKAGELREKFALLPEGLTLVDAISRASYLTSTQSMVSDETISEGWQAFQRLAQVFGDEVTTGVVRWHRAPQGDRAKWQISELARLA